MKALTITSFLYLYLAIGLLYGQEIEPMNNGADMREASFKPAASGAVYFWAVLPATLLVWLFIALRNKSDKKITLEKAPKKNSYCMVQVADLLASDPGNLFKIGGNLSIGGKLLQDENDVETYVFVVKFSKESLRNEMKRALDKERAKWRFLIQWLVAVVLVLVLLLLFK